MQVTKKSSLLSNYMTLEIFVILFTAYLPELMIYPHTPFYQAARNAAPLGSSVVPSLAHSIHSLNLFQPNIITHLKKLKNNSVPVCLNLVNDPGCDGILGLGWKFLPVSRPAEPADLGCWLKCSSQTPHLALPSASSFISYLVTTQLLVHVSLKPS